MLSWVHNEKRDSPSHPPTQPGGTCRCDGREREDPLQHCECYSGSWWANLAGSFWGWWAGAQGGPYSLPVLGSIPSRSTNGNVS